MKCHCTWHPVIHPFASASSANSTSYFFLLPSSQFSGHTPLTLVTDQFLTLAPMLKTDRLQEGVFTSKTLITPCSFRSCIHTRRLYLDPAGAPWCSVKSDMWVQHCWFSTVKQQKWPCEIGANTTHKRASPTILVLVERACSTHILQLKYYRRTVVKPPGFSRIEKQLFESNPFTRLPKKTVLNLPLQTVRSLHQCTA